MRKKKIIFNYIKGLLGVIGLAVLIEIVYCIMQKQESIFTYEGLKLIVGNIILYTILKFYKYRQKSKKS